MSEYRVEQEKAGCEHCGHGKGWIVVDSDDVGGSTVYDDEEDAQDEADNMNMAFERGRKRVQP